MSWTASQLVSTWSSPILNSAICLGDLTRLSLVSQVAADGSIVVAGATRSDAYDQANVGNNDILVAKLTPESNGAREVWVRSRGSTENDWAHAVEAL